MLSCMASVFGLKRRCQSVFNNTLTSEYVGHMNTKGDVQRRLASPLDIKSASLRVITEHSDVANLRAKSVDINVLKPLFAKHASNSRQLLLLFLFSSCEVDDLTGWIRELQRIVGYVSIAIPVLRLTQVFDEFFFSLLWVPRGSDLFFENDIIWV